MSFLRSVPPCSALHVPERREIDLKLRYETHNYNFNRSVTIVL